MKWPWGWNVLGYELVGAFWTDQSNNQSRKGVSGVCVVNVSRVCAKTLSRIVQRIPLNFYITLNHLEEKTWRNQSVRLGEVGFSNPQKNRSLVKFFTCVWIFVVAGHAPHGIRLKMLQPILLLREREGGQAGTETEGAPSARRQLDRRGLPVECHSKMVRTPPPPQKNSHDKARLDTLQYKKK